MLSIFFSYICFSNEIFFLNIKKPKFNVTRFADLYFYCGSSPIVLETVWKVLFLLSSASQGGAGEGILSPRGHSAMSGDVVVVSVVGVLLIPNVGVAQGRC